MLAAERKQKLPEQVGESELLKDKRKGWDRTKGESRPDAVQTVSAQDTVQAPPNIIISAHSLRDPHAVKHPGQGASLLGTANKIDLAPELAS